MTPAPPKRALSLRPLIRPPLRPLVALVTAVERPRIQSAPVNQPGSAAQRNHRKRVVAPCP